MTLRTEAAQTLATALNADALRQIAWACRQDATLLTTYAEQVHARDLGGEGDAQPYRADADVFTKLACYLERVAAYAG